MAKAQSKFPDFLSGGGEMGERIRNFNWENTPLGKPENWEQSLKTCIRIMLASSQPIWIGWGSQLIKLYNDPYKAIVGGKHPEALGQPASVVWKDIWKDIEPMLQTVMEQDEGTYVESQLLIMERNNYPEETYYTFSYTPIPGDKGGTAGMICFNTDDTARILNERALQVLRDLGKLSYTKTLLSEIYTKAAKVLAGNDKDFPFALFYEINEKDSTATQVAWAGNKEDYAVFPETIFYQAPDEQMRNISLAINTNEIVLSENNGRRPNVPKGFWDIAAKQFLHIPLKLSNHKLPAVILTVGLNPFRKYDNQYQQFIRLLSDQISFVMNNMHALEEERRRSDALAEIDRAKTVFFNNISHEFRTPLTLILGPLEDMLQHPDELAPQKLAGIETTHRNALRLLKLVNTLLDFSRIESGRIQARFTKTPIVELTTNLAGSFRSMIEKTGIKYLVQTSEISEAIYVDRSMWEKILFNLLSNAYKYTLRGEISVRLFVEQGKLLLEVADTGIGIPEEELTNLFQRFHRVHNAIGRSYEGTGIGLSMIRELIKLHGGSISATSIEGKGSLFRVEIPTGKHHLPAERIYEGAEDDFVSDFILPDITENRNIETRNTVLALPGDSPKILVVDDNADMRDHIVSVLSKSFSVTTANDGMDALLKINETLPDLVLSDIMMPVMDGVQLLTNIKKNPKTAHLPVILLSARAGEEARIEGYDTGADDYLIKPFSSKELLARINAQLKIAATRQHSERQIRNLFLQAPVAICIFRGKDFIVEVANEKMLGLWGKHSEEVLNLPVMIALPEIEGQGYLELLQNVYETGKRFVAPELKVELVRDGQLEELYVKFVYEALYEEDGTISGIMALADEITDEVNARKAIEESQDQLATALSGGELGTFYYDALTDNLRWSDKTREFLGFSKDTKISIDKFFEAIHPDDRENTKAAVESAFNPQGGGYYENEYRTMATDGTIRWIRSKGRAHFDDNGNLIRFNGVTQDITERKQSEQTIKESEERFRSLADQSPMIVFLADAAQIGQMSYFNQMWLTYTDQTYEEAIKRGWDNVVHPDDRAWVRQVYEEALHGQTSYVIDAVRLKRYDGMFRWHMIKGNPRFSGNNEFLGYAGIGLDIHERKVSEERLRESEERFRMLAQKLPQLVWVTDADGKQEFASARWEEYSGIKTVDSNTWAAIVHPDDLANINEAWTESLKTGKNYKTDARLRNKDGEYRWHSVIGEPVYDIEGKVTKWVGAFTDIHHEKTFSRQLEQLVESRTNELSAKNEDLEKMNKELESFAYISSHDLQEPLRKIQTFASRILDREHDALSDTGKQYFERMQDAAHRMQTLIEDLLAYSRTSSEDREFEKVNLSDIVDEIIEEFHENLIQNHGVIEKGSMCDISIIPFQFRQLMHNLIVNSLKFSKEDVPPHIHISSRIVTGKESGIEKLVADKQYCHITVADNGIGFDPSYGDKIFEVFQRLHGRDQYNGTGIGLAIVKRIIENHNGAISATGKPGEGATFNLYIPHA